MKKVFAFLLVGSLVLLQGCSLKIELPQKTEEVAK